MEIVRSWRHLIAGDFYVFRELKKYTVFLSTEKPPVAYGVLALAQPFDSMIGRYPVLVKTILLPFQDKIIYDGLMTHYSISFGPGIRQSLTETFNESKDRHGIVTALPIPAAPPIAAAVETRLTLPAKSKSMRKKKPKSKSGIEGRWRIISMSEWDEDYLDEEVEAYIEFDAKGGGSFQFGYVSGRLDSRMTARDEKPRVNFSWEGGDGADGTPLTGRGEAVLDGDSLIGTIYIHDGEDSEFAAKRARTR